IFLKDRLGIGALGIDPEFQHAARAMKRAGNASLTLDLARVAQVNDHHIAETDASIREFFDRLCRIDGLDLRIRLIEKFLVTAGDGGRHGNSGICESPVTRSSLSVAKSGVKGQ